MKGFIEVPDLDTGERRFQAVSTIASVIPIRSRVGCLVSTVGGGLFETSISYDAMLLLISDAAKGEP